MWWRRRKKRRRKRSKNKKKLGQDENLRCRTEQPLVRTPMVTVEISLLCLSSERKQAPISEDRLSSETPPAEKR